MFGSVGFDYCAMDLFYFAYPITQDLFPSRVALLTKLVINMRTSSSYLLASIQSQNPILISYMYL